MWQPYLGFPDNHGLITIRKASTTVFSIVDGEERGDRGEGSGSWQNVLEWDIILAGTVRVRHENSQILWNKGHGLKRSHSLWICQHVLVQPGGQRDDDRGGRDDAGKLGSSRHPRNAPIVVRFLARQPSA